MEPSLGKSGPKFDAIDLDLDLEWFILTQIFAHDVHYKFEYYGHGIWISHKTLINM